MDCMQAIQEISKLLEGTAIQMPRMSPKQVQEAHKANAPILRDRQPASKAGCSSLNPIRLSDLSKDQRHEKKVIYLAIQSTKLHNGMTLAVKDANGKLGAVWSLIEHPFPGGETSLAKDTVIAVKEPYYGTDVNGKLAICVHHPTDIIRFSQYDAVVSKHFPALAGSDHGDFAKAGADAFRHGHLMEAVDIYSEGIKRAGPMPEDHLDASDELADLLKKRAFTYSKLKLFVKAKPDAIDFIQCNFMDENNVKLAISVMMNVGNAKSAAKWAEMLPLMWPDKASSHRILAQAQKKLKAEEGHFDPGEIAKSAVDVGAVADLPNFHGNFEIRTSSLHGRGAFAKCDIKQGELLLCEKPNVICRDGTTSSFVHGLKGAVDKGPVDGEDGWISQGSVAFLQAMATAASTDPCIMTNIFTLFDGRGADSNRSEAEMFDSFRALGVMKHNSHSIPCGNGSYMYDNIFDPQYNGDQRDIPKARGLWILTSLFNHSCLPNATYAPIANLMAIRASRDLKEGEEITLAYADPELPFCGRIKHLIHMRFPCYCPLCTADLAMPQAQLYRLEERLMKFILASTKLHDPAQLLSEVRQCLAAYRNSSYGDMPYVGMARMMLNLGHAYLGPLKDWEKAPANTKDTAAVCFITALDRCLGIKLIADNDSGYCELVFSKHGQPLPAGILALVALAELAYLSNNSDDTKTARVASMLACAKLVYKLRYGEDATFDDHHKGYKCMEVLARKETLRAPKHWEEVKAKGTAKVWEIPAFLL